MSKKERAKIYYLDGSSSDFKVMSEEEIGFHQERPSVAYVRVVHDNTLEACEENERD